MNFILFWVLWIIVWCIVLFWLIPWINKSQTRSWMRLRYWYENTEQYKCCDCRQPIMENDDARLCTNCGGRNFRADSEFTDNLIGKQTP